MVDENQTLANITGAVKERRVSFKTRRFEKAIDQFDGVAEMSAFQRVRIESPAGAVASSHRKFGKIGVRPGAFRA